MRFTAVRSGQAVPVAEIPQWLRSLRSAKSYDRKVTHVTSQNLCDDVLQLLKPTLPPPHTCDIIDLNPGPCLWSQKLNDLLKPRRHVLVEPHYDTFSSFIEPLLRQPGSVYRHVASMKKALDPKNKLLSDDIYQFRKHVANSREEKLVTNEKLLITANLSATGRRVVGFTGTQAKQYLNDHFHSIFATDDYIHRYGFARLLAWVDRDSKKSIMPTSVNARTKQSIQLEAAYTITQVAGPSQFEDLYVHQKRWYDLEAENQAAVRERQDEDGIVMSPDRKQPEPILPFTALEPKIEVVRKHEDRYPHNQVYIKRVLGLDDTLSAENPDWYAKYQQEIDDNFKHCKEGRKFASTPMQTTYRLLMSQLRTHHNTYLKAKVFIWEQRQLFKRFLKAWESGWFSSETGMPADGLHKEKAMELIEADQSMSKERQKFKKDTRALINKAGDDYRCFDTNHKIMAWNQRQYDPLLVQPDEFYPRTPLVLLNLDPRKTLPLQIDSLDKQICFDYVCTSLMTFTGDTVLQGIKRLVPAGHEQFLERIPELRDVSRGGWWDLDSVRVRSLHTDMFIKIALALYHWPHRPKVEKLMSVYKGVYDKGPV